MIDDLIAQLRKEGDFAKQADRLQEKRITIAETASERMQRNFSESYEKAKSEHSQILTNEQVVELASVSST